MLLETSYCAIFALGFVCGVSTPRLGDGRLRTIVLISRSALYSGAAGAILTVALMLAHLSGSVFADAGAIASIFAAFFLDGLLLAAVLLTITKANSAIPRGRVLLRNILSCSVVRAARYLVASYFVMVGLSKLTTFNTLSFFQVSGYSKGFYIFICVLACICAVALLLPRISIVAICVLFVEMLGAIYTHFHNYFSKGLPGPFSNSLDAFRMMILLLFLAFAALPERAISDPSFARSHEPDC